MVIGGQAKQNWCLRQLIPYLLLTSIYVNGRLRRYSDLTDWG
jgi:hypothetical protein